MTRRTFAGKFDLDGFYSWLNPELPHAERFSRSRLLSSFAEIDEATYWHFLEMLPPIYHRNGFAICEATTADVRLGFFHLGERYFAAHVSDHDTPHKPDATCAVIEQAKP